MLFGAKSHFRSAEIILKAEQQCEEIGVEEALVRHEYFRYRMLPAQKLWMRNICMEEQWMEASAFGNGLWSDWHTGGAALSK